MYNRLSVTFFSESRETIYISLIIFLLSVDKIFTQLPYPHSFLLNNFHFFFYFLPLFHAKLYKSTAKSS